MGIYFSKIRTLLEVKRKVDGQEQDLDEENEDQSNNEPEEQENNQEENEDDGDDEHQADNSASDYSMDVEDDDEESEEPAEADAQDYDTNENDDEHQANNSASDYSMDTEDDNDGDEEQSNDTEGEDNSDASDGYSMDTADNETESDDSEEEEPAEDSSEGGENELKSLEDDIFKDITPEQMNIKILELKKQYLEVYTAITDILTRTNKIQKTTQNIKVLEFIINKLMELKDIVQFYLSNTFDTKTYMENMVNYQQYLVTLNTINRLLKEINVKKGK